MGNPTESPFERKVDSDLQEVANEGNVELLDEDFKMFKDLDASLKSGSLDTDVLQQIVQTEMDAYYKTDATTPAGHSEKGKHLRKATVGKAILKKVAKMKAATETEKLDKAGY